MKKKRTLDTRAVALRLGVSDRTVRRWADRGWVSAFRTLGGHRRFDARSVEKAETLSRTEIGSAADLLETRKL